MTDKIVTLRRGDPDFKFGDNFVEAPRACIELSDECPSSIAAIVMHAYNNGWLIPIAQMRENELLWIKLSTTN